MAPTSTGKWIADPTFAALLAEHGCAPEISFTGACDPTETDADGSCEAPIVGTAICPDDIVSAVTAYDVRYNTGITAEIPCDTCTGQPSANQVVIAWVVQVAGTEVPCFPAAGLTCSVPGAGCKAVNCFVQY